MHFFVKEEELSVTKIKKNIYNCKEERRLGLNTINLLHKKMKEKDYSKIKLQNTVGCCEKTLRKYLNGATTSGPYLTKILEVLDISVAEWNECENIQNEEVV